MKKHGRRVKIKGRIVAVAVMVLLVVSLSPGISAASIECNMTDELNEHPMPTTRSDGLIDNVITKCDGTYLISIPEIILGFAVNFIVLKHLNYGIPVYINTDIKLETGDGRLLVEFSLHRPHQSAGTVMTPLFNRYDWKYFGYRFGPFDMTVGVTIRDDGSHETLVFHGFKYFFRAVIFNPYGEKIE